MKQAAAREGEGRGPDGWRSGYSSTTFFILGERPPAPALTVNGASFSIRDTPVFTASAQGAEQMWFEAEFLRDGEWIQDSYYPFYKNAEDGRATMSLVWFENQDISALRFRARAKINGVWSSFTDWVEVSIEPDSSWEGDNLYLPKGLTEIEAEAFEGVKARIVVLPEQMKRIGSRAFANCGMLCYIYIPASVTYIAPDAFEGCSSNLTLCANEGNSFVEQYAEAHNMKFSIWE